MKLFNWVFLKYKKINLGTLPVKELTILENKKFFSLKLFYFGKGIAQERYHSHSFESWSFRFFGNYIEKVLDENYINQDLPRNRSRIISIPKERFHQISNSNGCMTLMLTGKWGDYYHEYYPEQKLIVTSTHGRKEVSRLFIK